MPEYKSGAVPLCYAGLSLVLAALRTPWLPVGLLATTRLLCTLLTSIAVAEVTALRTLLNTTVVLPALGALCVSLRQLNHLANV